MDCPSASNWQETDIYAAMEKGLYRYDQKAHTLQGVKGGGLHADTGLQKFGGGAPLNLAYVAELRRM